QLLILASVVFLVSPKDVSKATVNLEWSAFTVALLTISTLPASYHFTLLILPATVLAAWYLRESKDALLSLLLVVYLGIGFPAWPHGTADGWHALIAVPRLYLLLLLIGMCCVTLYCKNRTTGSIWIDRRAWAVAFFVLLAFQILAGLRHQRGLHDLY